MGTVGFLRNYFISKCFSKIFEKIFIISIKNITIPARDNIPVDFAVINRVFHFDYRNLMNLISCRKSYLRKSINTGSSSRIVKFFRRMIDSFPLNTMVGEGGFFYIINGTIKALRLLKKNHITHLYSSYRPIADHIIAFNVKLFYPNIRWIADFRDLPVDYYRKNTFLPGFQTWFIKLLISKANEVITVSEGLNSVLNKIKPESKVIRNGVFKLYETEKNHDNDHFLISYTGSLYPEFQKPVALFKTVKSLIDNDKISKMDFKLIYAGKDSAVWNKWVVEYRLQDISHDLGELTLFESVSTQTSSSLLLLLSWSNKDHKGILTGKLFEYLATGNPILVLINGERDEEIERIVEKSKSGVVFYNDNSESLEKTIMSYYNKWKKNVIIKTEPNPKLEKLLSWDNVSEQLKKLI